VLALTYLLKSLDRGHDPPLVASYRLSERSLQVRATEVEESKTGVAEILDREKRPIKIHAHPTVGMFFLGWNLARVFRTLYRPDPTLVLPGTEGSLHSRSRLHRTKK
jgi:hypothetical protein